MAKKQGTHLLILVTTLLIGWLYGQCIDTEVIGSLRDDGLYTILAKALATGQGFHLIHLPLHPAQWRYPILYPFILSLGWRLNPNFPDNLPLLNLLTVAFSIAALPLVFYYFRSCKNVPVWIAWLLVLLVAASNLAYGTTLMSEGPFLFFSLLTVFVAEKTLPTGSRKSLLLCVLLSILTFHTRTIGLMLILAIALWLGFRKRYQDALLYTGLSLLFTLLPWALWTHWAQPHPLSSLDYPILNPYRGYTAVLNSLMTQPPAQYWNTLLGNLGAMVMALLNLLCPFWVQYGTTLPSNASPWVTSAYFLSVLLFAYGLLGYFLVQILHQVKVGSTQGWSKAFSISGLYLVLYCVSILFWNYESHLGRFLSVVSPWLWYYLFKPLFMTGSQSLKAWGARLLVLALSGLALWGVPWHYKMLYFGRKGHFLTTEPQLASLWKEYKETFAYIRTHLPANAPLGAFYETTVYLYTDHPTIFAFFPALRTQNGIPLPTADAEFMQSMRQHHISYFLLEPQLIRIPGMGASENLFVKHLVTQYPQQFKVLYTSPRGMITLYQWSPPTALPETLSKERRHPPE